MESVKDPLLQLLRSHLQEMLTTVEQFILDLVEWYLQGPEPQGGTLEPLSPASDAPVARRSLQEQEFVLRPSDDEEQSSVKIKEEPGAECIQATNMQYAPNPEREGPGPTTDTTSDRGRSDRERQRAERRYLCEVCGKLFQSKWYLAIHQRVHTGERPYTCAACPKSFKQASHLKAHKLIHTGERPHPCGMCEKSFKLSSDLMRHKRVHTGERPYPCDLCSKSFNQSGSLKTHKLIHTGERPHPCGVCERSFRTRSKANRHKQIHCERSFGGTEPGEGEQSYSSRRHSTS